MFMKICANLSRKRAWLCAAAFFVLVAFLNTASAQNLPPLNRDAIVGHLNTVITWYRDTTNKVQPAGLPSDAIYQDSTRNLAAEVVRLAFQSARAEAAVIGATEKNPNANQASTPPAQQNLTQIAARIAAQIDDTQSKLGGINKQLATAPRSKRKALLVERERPQGELSRSTASRDVVQTTAACSEETPDSAAAGL